jgi:hypothetical protein
MANHLARLTLAPHRSETATTAEAQPRKPLFGINRKSSAPRCWYLHSKFTGRGELSVWHPLYNAGHYSDATGPCSEKRCLRWFSVAAAVSVNSANLRVRLAFIVLYWPERQLVCQSASLPTKTATQVRNVAKVPGSGFYPFYCNRAIPADTSSPLAPPLVRRR